MIEQRIFCGVVIATVVSVGIGCDEEKKPAVADAAPAVSEESRAVELAPEPKKEESEVAEVNEMVFIPGGSFMMGSKNSKQKDEKPRRVTVRPFYMDVTEVTLGAYAACIKEGKCTYGDYDHFCTWGKRGKTLHPINCIDWEQAKAYCEGVGKRLPTEAEWEFAARGTEGRTYAWGNEGPPPKGICFNRPKKGTCPVHEVPVDSPFGLRGMAGNVWEWTADGYNEDYNKPRKNGEIVYRGASFLEEDLEDLRATLRNYRPPTVRMDYLGFRCASTTKPKTK